MQGLRAHGHQVILSVPKTALRGFKNSPHFSNLENANQIYNDLAKNAFDSFNQANIIAETEPDVILCGHWPALSFRTKPSQALVIDLAGPHLLERHYQGSGEHQVATVSKLSTIATADYYIASGPSQRLYFLSYILRAEKQDAENLIATITMPLDPQLPKRAETDLSTYPNFFFGGVFLPWQDPSESLLSLCEELEKRGKGNLKLVGGKHPNYPIKVEAYQRLFNQLARSPQVSTQPMLTFDKFTDELCKADVALDLMKWNLERLLSVNIRTTTYLWAGLPVIYNDYADLRHLIEKYDAGWCIDVTSRDALNNVLDEIYSSPEIVRQKSINAQTLARETFAWDKAVEPLLKLLGASSLKKFQELDISLDRPDNANLQISEQRKLEQSFVSRLNGLSKVELRVAAGENPPPLKLRLFRASSNSTRQRELVVEKIAASEEIKKSDWLGFEIEPIKNSAGDTFTLELSVANSQNTVNPWILRTNPYPLKELHHNGQLLKGQSICMRTTCTVDRN